MADFTKRIIFIVLPWILTLELVSASNYCEWNFCTPEEDCCGFNQCCPKSIVSTKTLTTVAWVLSGLLTFFILYRASTKLYRLFSRQTEERKLIESS